VQAGGDETSGKNGGEVVMTGVCNVASGLAQIATEVSGDGMPIALLHAGVADRRMWRNQVDALAHVPARYRAVAYDRRGFGDTLHTDEPYSHVDDLLAVLAATTSGAPAVLVGCSQGGKIAIDCALAHPDRVRALVLVAPAVSGAPEIDSFPPPIQAWLDRMEKAEAAGDIDDINAFEAHAWLDGPLGAEGRVHGPARDLFLAMNDVALRAEARGAEHHAPSAYDRLGDIGVPTLLVWGDLDFPHLVERCEYLAAQIPDVRTQVMHGTAHLPNLERPAEFNRVLLDFLAAL
jgi:pimeloyl-ACP methyl ester carboxylesterase